MPFIRTIPAAEAKDDVRAMYQRQQQAWGYVPDYARVFSHRPEVMARWGKLLAEIKRPVDPRRLEMVTLSAALELHHTPCSLAHGAELAKIIGKDAVIAIANGEDHDEITEAEQAMMQFARQVARDASKINADDVGTLKEVHGFTDEEIFDIAAVAASRSFFTKVLDALGSMADRSFLKLDENLRHALTVGRPISHTPPEYLDKDQAA
ncbi:MAG: peroxidase [Gammaproteobacteria bacterium]|nr:MAG: peroxidase [Gammaproteobacteria bacterium]UCH38696.1 MAG: peroxidase [Gammaproteobacteria bacterium]